MKKSLLLILLFFAADNYAQLFPTLGGQRAGISTAQFLKIGIGARATAMGDAFVAVADDPSALYWNPAGLVQNSNNGVIISHNEWLAEISHDFIGAMYHISDNDAVGVSLTALYMDDMPVTTEFNPLGTGEYFTFSDIAIGVSYARKMTSQFSFGATIRYMEETLDKLKMRGVLVDLGTYYWTGLGTTRFAVAITNFGNQLAPDGEVVLIGKRSKTSWQAFSPPTMFRIGFAFEPYQTDEHKVTTSIQLNHPNDNSENVSTGAEYTWNDSFFLRGGYKINVEGQDLSLGAGVKMDLDFAAINFSYAFANFSSLGSSHRFSLIFNLF